MDFQQERSQDSLSNFESWSSNFITQYLKNYSSLEYFFKALTPFFKCHVQHFFKEGSPEKKKTFQENYTFQQLSGLYFISDSTNALTKPCQYIPNSSKLFHWILGVELFCFPNEVSFAPETYNKLKSPTVTTESWFWKY